MKMMQEEGRLKEVQGEADHGEVVEVSIDSEEDHQEEEVGEALERIPMFQKALPFMPIMSTQAGDITWASKTIKTRHTN